MYGHTRLDGQHICRSSAGRCLIMIHPIARTSCPVIYIFSYISRNSCPVSVSVFSMTERRVWMLQCFLSQAADFYDAGYKSWPYGMTNVSIPEMNMLKNNSRLAVYVAPRYFHLSLRIKKFQSGLRFQNYRRRWVSQWFKSQTADFYDTGYKRWFHGMTNVSVSEMNMFKNISILTVCSNKSFY